MDEMTAEEQAHRLFNSLRGKMAGFIEACDLDERKERSLISTLKDYSYTTEERIVKLLK